MEKEERMQENCSRKSNMTCFSLSYNLIDMDESSVAGQYGVAPIGAFFLLLEGVAFPHDTSNCNCTRAFLKRPTTAHPLQRRIFALAGGQAISLWCPRSFTVRSNPEDVGFQTVADGTLFWSPTASPKPSLTQFTCRCLFVSDKLYCMVCLCCSWMVSYSPFLLFLLLLLLVSGSCCVYLSGSNLFETPDS